MHISRGSSSDNTPPVKRWGLSFDTLRTVTLLTGLPSLHLNGALEGKRLYHIAAWSFYWLYKRVMELVSLYLNMSSWIERLYNYWKLFQLVSNLIWSSYWLHSFFFTARPGYVYHHLFTFCILPPQLRFSVYDWKLRASRRKKMTTSSQSTNKNVAQDMHRNCSTKRI